MILSKTLPEISEKQQAPIPSDLSLEIQKPNDDIEAENHAIRKNICMYMEKFEGNGLNGGQHVLQYLNDQRRRGCRAGTIKSSFYNIFIFTKYLEKAGQTLETFTRNDLVAYVEHEQDRGIKAYTVKFKLMVLYAFSAYLVENEIIHPKILKRKLQIRIPDALPRAIDPKDIRQLLSVIKEPRDRAIILTLLRTGMRIGELLHTRVSDVNLGEERIEIFEARKNRVGRVVYLSEDAMAALQVWLQIRDPSIPHLFYARCRQTLSYSGAKGIFVKYLRLSGLSGKGYSLHALRHTFASELLNAGMRLECLQQLLGHSSIEMTRRYARLTDVTRKDEYFRAMAKIEKGEIDGHYRCDHQLPPVH